jgi:hypothetical protein
MSLLATYIVFLNLIIFSILNYTIMKLSEARDFSLSKASLKLFAGKKSDVFVTLFRLLCSLIALICIIYTTTNFLVPISLPTDYIIYCLIPLLYFGYDEKAERSIFVTTLISFALASLLFKTGSANFEIFSFNQLTISDKNFLNSYFLQDPIGFIALTIGLLEVIKQYQQRKRVTTLVYLGALFTLYVVVYFGGAMPPLYLHEVLGEHRLMFSIFALFSFILKYLAIVFVVTLMALAQKKSAYLSNS